MKELCSRSEQWSRQFSSLSPAGLCRCLLCKDGVIDRLALLADAGVADRRNLPKVNRLLTMSEAAFKQLEESCALDCTNNDETDEDDGNDHVGHDYDDGDRVHRWSKSQNRSIQTPAQPHNGTKHHNGVRGLEHEHMGVSGELALGRNELQRGNHSRGTGRGIAAHWQLLGVDMDSDDDDDNADGEGTNDGYANGNDGGVLLSSSSSAPARTPTSLGSLSSLVGRLT